MKSEQSKSEAMRELAERVESALVLEKDDSPDFCTRPSLVQALFDQIKGLQNQLDFVESVIFKKDVEINNLKALLKTTQDCILAEGSSELYERYAPQIRQAIYPYP